MRKALLILPASRMFTTEPGGDSLSYVRWSNARDLHQANIVIVRNSTHFCCIKNRYSDEVDNRDRIPNRMMMSYVLKYAEHFTKEELIGTIVDLSLEPIDY